MGTVNHALNQARAGVDVLIAAGGEAGGHCGAVSTMVLVPEVCRALKQHNLSVPVLAAGGIATGEQMAAAMTMGAEGAWCGSVWLTTVEAETTPTVKRKMIAATASDTVRAKSERVSRHDSCDQRGPMHGKAQVLRNRCPCRFSHWFLSPP